MDQSTALSWQDAVLPFQLERSGVRGRAARLGPLLDHILTRHEYPDAVAGMLAELVTLTALIGPTIKLRWKLSMQVRGNGAIRTLATDYYAPQAPGEPARIRAWASFDAARLGGDMPGLARLGEGYMAVLIRPGRGHDALSGNDPADR